MQIDVHVFSRGICRLRSRSADRKKPTSSRMQCIILATRTQAHSHKSHTNSTWYRVSPPPDLSLFLRVILATQKKACLAYPLSNNLSIHALACQTPALAVFGPGSLRRDVYTNGTKMRCNISIDPPSFALHRFESTQFEMRCYLS